jgi:hypothetical protein
LRQRPKRMASGDRLPRHSADDSAAEKAQPSKACDFGLASYEVLDYTVDVWQRSILFWDTLRQRADNMLEYEQRGLAPVLDFEHECLLDARTFDRPANYALLRILAVGDDCLQDCVDATRPPVIIIDPRAGHGPGIGGFKRDSEVGVALHEGHPVYFVVFFPEPCPGQTLKDVLQALRRFVEHVNERHAGALPILYGNCQAGWAVALLAADCEGLAGPAVLNGSPLSYWAGEPGANPMRLAGGLLGGAWLAHLAADLGNGTFDGAWLVQSFEALKPDAVWEKYADLFLHVDQERERFLDFERWWNGYYSLSREEILSVIENLFIGNELEQGKIRLCPGCYVDLRRIRNPLVIFASYGDNITPPHQALGWIPVVYESTDQLKSAGQRIAYLLNPHIGHLGIFVSAKVARFEHRAILESLGEIEALDPGLYEMNIDNPTGDPDCRKPQYAVTFEPRRVEDLRFGVSEESFERVRQISELNEAAYHAFISPMVQALSTPWSAAWLKWLHPMRVSRYAFSEMFNLWILGCAIAAEMVRQGRVSLPEGNPFVAHEKLAIRSVSEALEHLRTLRDSTFEQIFEQIYGQVLPSREGSNTGSFE